MTNLPKTAETFLDFMDEVWEGTCRPDEHGGVIITDSPLYEKWHDARVTAQACGAFKRWSQKLNDEAAYVYEFPDGSRVNIAAHGGAARLVRRQIRTILEQTA